MPMIKDNHLGGFVLGGDDRCYYPEVWDQIIGGFFNAKSLIDVGCGEGHSSKYFSDRGVEVLAIDGSKKVLDTAVYSPIVIHDYVTGPYIPEKEYDVVWCCEFVEHVGEMFMDNFLETFKKAKYVVMTHALPGQGGYHHVNEQDDGYWIAKMKDIGYFYEEEISKHLRSLGHDYFEKSGMVFSRDE